MPLNLGGNSTRLNKLRITGMIPCGWRSQWYPREMSTVRGKKEEKKEVEKKANSRRKGEGQLSPFLFIHDQRVSPLLLSSLLITIVKRKNHPMRPGIYTWPHCQDTNDGYSSNR